MEIITDSTKFKIYKITSISYPDLVYFGHTSQPLINRFALHKSHNNKTARKIIMDKGDAVISLVEEFICATKNEAMDKEAKYILNNVCCNKNIPNNKCYYDKEKMKQYNKDRIFKLKDIVFFKGKSSDKNNLIVVWGRGKKKNGKGKEGK